MPNLVLVSRIEQLFWYLDVICWTIILSFNLASIKLVAFLKNLLNLLSMLDNITEVVQGERYWAK